MADEAIPPIARAVATAQIQIPLNAIPRYFDNCARPPVVRALFGLSIPLAPDLNRYNHAVLRLF